MRFSACASLFLTALVACSNDEDPVQPPPPIALSQTIGPAGGTLASADGRVRLTVPAGALTADVIITIDELTSTAAPAVPGATFAFGPTGTVFAIPAALSIRYDQSRLRTGTAETSLTLARRVGAQEWEVERSVVDVAANRVTGEIRTFSDHGVAATVVIDPPVLTAEYQPDRTIDLTPMGTVPGSIFIEAAKATGLGEPSGSAFSQIGGIQGLNTVLTYSLDASAGVYWFRARYSWLEEGTTWYGTYTDPPARVIVFGLPDFPARATTFTATPVAPGAIDLDFTFPSPGQNSPVSGYRISRSKPGSASDGLIELALADALPYHDTGLSPDTEYTYSLVAWNERGEGPPLVISARTPPLPPTACRAYAVAVVNPPSAANRGANLSIDVTVTRLGGFAGAITLALTGTGTQAIEDVQLTNPGTGNSGRIQFKVKSDAPIATASFTLEANSGGEFCPTDFQIEVRQPVTPSFGKLNAQPGTLSLTAGTNGAIWLGNPGSTTLALAATAPAGSGITVTFVPASITGVAVAIIRAGAQAVPGVYSVTITGTGQGETRSVNLEVTLGAVSSFAVSMPSPINWQRDQSSSHQGTLNRGEAFPNPVTMTVPDLPAGVSHGFSPSVITADPPVPIVLGIHVFPQAAPGLHIISVTGTAGSTVRAARVLAVVDGQTNVPGAVTLIPESRVTLSRTTSPASVDVLVVIARPAALIGTPLTLSVTGLPPGITATFGANPATANTILTLSAAPNATLGTTQLTLTATGGPQTVTAPIALTVVGNAP